MDREDRDVVGIIIFDDDTTPMEFVVDLLTREFGLEHRRSVDLMLKVHDEGFAIVETASRADALQRLAQVQDAIRSNGSALCVRIIEDPLPIIENRRRAAATPPEQSLPLRILIWLFRLVMLAIVAMALVVALHKIFGL